MSLGFFKVSSILLITGDFRLTVGEQLRLLFKKMLDVKEIFHMGLTWSIQPTIFLWHPV